MSKWKEVELGDVVEIIKDSFKPNGKTNFRYIGLEHIEQERLRISSYGCSTEIGSNKFFFKKEDILFGKLRPYFRKVAQPDFEGVCSTDIWVIRAKKTFSQDYLFYFLSNWEFIDTAYASSSGSRMPRADWNFLKNTTWSFPPLPEQRAIADVLSSLDDKIDLLHRQNQTLESLAQTLFRQWFIEEAEEDWEEGVLGDEFDFTMGQSPPGSSYNESGEGTPMFQGNADFGFRFPTERVYTIQPKRMAQPLDTLISVRAPVGAQNMAKVECCIGRGLAAFRYKHNSVFYTYTYFKMRSLLDEILKFNEEGTVFGSISKSDFQAIKVLLPPQELIQKYEANAKPMNDKIIKNCEQIQTLENLRDTLLPKLMSGEVRVALEG